MKQENPIDYTHSRQLNVLKKSHKVSIRPTPIAISKHEAGAHQYPYLYG